MSVSNVARWHGGKADEMVPAARKAKDFMMKHGAETALLNRVHTGSNSGDWLFVTRYADWAALAKAQEGLAKDSGYQKLVASVSAMSTMVERTILNGHDI
jgi:hypothetical protein